MKRCHVPTLTLTLKRSIDEKDDVAFDLCEVLDEILPDAFMKVTPQWVHDHVWEQQADPVVKHHEHHTSKPDASVLAATKSTVVGPNSIPALQSCSSSAKEKQSQSRRSVHHGVSDLGEALPDPVRTTSMGGTSLTGTDTA